MASLLVCVVDDHNRDPYCDVKAIKRGDVLAVRENDHPWSGASLHDPRFRIITFPAASIEEAAVLLSPELPTKPTMIPDPMLQLRGFCLCLNALHDDIVLAPLADFIEKKPALLDPNVIG